MHKRLVSGAIAIVLLGGVATPASADHRSGGNEGDAVRVRLIDNCDPATFNALLGPGACVPHGHLPNVTVPQFFAKLNPVDFGHPAWRNSPSRIELDGEETLSVVVRGGEEHTFTEVPAFGGGCVPPLNDALGLTMAAPEICAQFEATAVYPVGSLEQPAGTTLNVGPLDTGTHRFMCLIHPWMRTTVTVEGDDDDN
jgi:plastocyanin